MPPKETRASPPPQARPKNDAGGAAGAHGRGLSGALASTVAGLFLAGAGAARVAYDGSLRRQ